MSKTVKEWLQELPAGYRQMALKNLELQDAQNKRATRVCQTMHSAIDWAFTWEYTTEWKQHKFKWSTVHAHYYEIHKGTTPRPLPKLPPGLLREPEAFRAKISLIAGAGGHRA